MTPRSITPSIDEIIGAADNDLEEAKSSQASSDELSLFDESKWYLQPYKPKKTQRPAVQPNRPVVYPQQPPVRPVRPPVNNPPQRRAQITTPNKYAPSNGSSYTNLAKNPAPQQPVKKNTGTRIFVGIMVAIITIIIVIFVASNISAIQPAFNLSRGCINSIFNDNINSLTFLLKYNL